MMPCAVLHRPMRAVVFSLFVPCHLSISPSTVPVDNHSLWAMPCEYGRVSLDEANHIARWHSAGKTMGEIARPLGRDKGTISGPGVGLGEGSGG